MFIAPFTHSAEAFGTDIDTLPIDEKNKPVFDTTDIDQILDTDVADEENQFADDLNEELQGSESLLMEIEHLQNLAVAIETYGISPGMMFVADRDGLLASTFISIPATESMTGPYRSDSQTSQAALEGVIDAIKSKTAEWAAKAGGIVKSLVAKVGGAIKSAVEWSTSFAKTVASKTWDATKAAGATIKAHPYKTVAAVLAAIAAVAAVLALIWAFPTQAAQVEAWRKRVVSAVTNIKMPGGKFVTKAALNAKNPNATPDVIKWAKETFPETPAKVNTLGWTKNAVTSAATSLSGALGKVKSVLGKIVEIAHKPARFWAELVSGSDGNFPEASKLAAMRGGEFEEVNHFRNQDKYFKYHEVFPTAMMWTWILISTVIIGGYFLIKKTVSKVVSAVSGGGKKEPTTV